MAVYGAEFLGPTKLPTPTNSTDAVPKSYVDTTSATKVTKGVDVYLKDYITGDGVADDTSGWNAAIAALPATGGKLVVESGINSKVNGALTFTGKSNVRVSGAGAKITQTAANAKTLNFVNCSGVVVEGLEFVGKGTENIKQGAAVTSYNGVAAVFFNNCQRVAVRTCLITNHAGGGIRWTNNLRGAVFSGLTIVGMGGTPGNSDNCSDFAIGMSGASSDESIWIEDCDISGHNFGIFIIQCRGTHVVRNSIHDIPGQHAVYASECYDVDLSFNTMWNIALVGIKNQIGNVPVDAAGCKVIGNNINGCLHGIVVASVFTDLSYKFTLGDVSHNVVRNAVQDGINLVACLQFQVTHNLLDTCGRYGMFANDFSGAMTDNQIWRTQAHGTYAVLVDHAKIEQNSYSDCALNASSTAGWTSVIAAYRSANYLVSTPSLTMDQNSFRFTSAEPGTYAYAVITGANLTAYNLSARNFTSKNYSLALSATLPPTSGGGSAFGFWSPAANGYLGATADPQLISSGQGAMTAGVLYLGRVKIPDGGLIAAVRVAVSVAGSSLTSGQCLLGLWDTSGALIGYSADLSSTLTSTGVKSVSLTVASGKSLTVSAGTELFCGLLQNGTTPAQLRGTVSSAFANDRLSGLGLRFATMGTGQTALPDPLSSLAASTAQWFFAVTA